MRQWMGGGGGGVVGQAGRQVGQAEHPLVFFTSPPRLAEARGPERFRRRETEPFGFNLPPQPPLPPLSQTLLVSCSLPSFLFPSLEPAMEEVKGGKKEGKPALNRRVFTASCRLSASRPR